MLFFQGYGFPINSNSLITLRPVFLGLLEGFFILTVKYIFNFINALVHGNLYIYFLFTFSDEREGNY